MRRSGSPANLRLLYYRMKRQHSVICLKSSTMVCSRDCILLGRDRVSLTKSKDFFIALARSTIFLSVLNRFDTTCKRVQLKLRTGASHLSVPCTEPKWPATQNWDTDVSSCSWLVLFYGKLNCTLTLENSLMTLASTSSFAMRLPRDLYSSLCLFFSMVWPSITAVVESVAPPESINPFLSRACATALTFASAFFVEVETSRRKWRIPAEAVVPFPCGGLRISWAID